MDNRFVAATVLIVIASVAGCSEESKPERARVAKITVDGKTQTAHEISCTQVEFALTIKTTSGSTRTDTFLEMGGETPVAKTVNISNFDGFSGVAGEGVGQTDVSLVNGDFVIAGTAEGYGSGQPGKKRSAPFRIETGC
jgi:lipoprotein LpqH